MNFEGRYKQLNDSQKQAVDAIDGPVMVIAGPGTGKTELLSMRVANILRRTDTLPENILCLTYTESGVTAMRERLIGIIGQAAYKVAIHTFHSFGSEVMNQYREYFYEGALFTPADEVQQYEILRSIFEELPLTDPLAGKMNGEYTYYRDALSSISDLKKAGLTSGELLSLLDDNDLILDKAERLLSPILGATISKSMLPALKQVLSELKQEEIVPIRFEVMPLSQVIIDSLEEAIDSVEMSGKTTALTAWKNRFFEKDKEKNLVFKDRKRQKKLRSLSFIYDQYISRMQAASVYDFDDMILQVVHALEVHDDLRYSLQERYHYLLVDEFQDTNLAQMRILHNLTNNPVNEGKPNIFIVGDDDQAIYSFQGADVSNILTFSSTYPLTERIVLKTNYRSTATILDGSREVIIQGQERLERLYEDLDKKLSAFSSDEGEVTIVKTPRTVEERQWLISDIKHQLDKGVAASDIAVLTRRHQDLASLLPFFSEAGISVSYERSDDILQLEPILFLEKIGRLIILLSQNRLSEANALLPELLSHPALTFRAEDLWRLSTQAYEKRVLWLDAMEAIPAFIPIRQLILELVAESHTKELPLILDRLIGKPDGIAYEYFFGETAQQSTPSSYLLFLEALTTLRTKLLEYNSEELATLHTLIEFIDLHRRLNTKIQIKHMVGDSQAVHLMTAHGSKGLEYPHVYIFNALDGVWGSKARSRSSMISYPENLQIGSVGESYDERLRLFYVALTRAKHHLTISYSELDDNDKAVLPAVFLTDSQWPTKEIQLPETNEHKTKLVETNWYQTVTEPITDLRSLLLPRMDTYRLSATHLLSFLNICDGGPQSFLVDHLLHFPMAENVHAAYGSAIHRTLQQAHMSFTSTGVMKPLEDSLKDFEENLRLTRITAQDFEKYLQQGIAHLSRYLTERASSFSKDQKVELDFARQQVTMDEVRLTGKLDLVSLDTNKKTMCISDYKTGHPALTWQGSTDYEKQKLHRYKQQLMFYKILVEHSRDYGSYTVDEAYLEFIEPTESGQCVSLALEYSKEELDEFKKLIQVVWAHIITLTLPDVSHYEPTLKGVLEFEHNLLEKHS